MQEFDLNSLTPSPEWDLPHQSDDTEQAQQTDDERFWLAIGNWAEFLTYFAAGLSASLLSRLLPSLMAVGIIAAIASLAAFAILLLSSNNQKERTFYALLLVSFTTSLVAGYWDALLAIVLAAIDWVYTNRYWLLATGIVTVLLQLQLWKTFRGAT